MGKLEQVIFYSLDKTIKVYRQFAQRRINDTGFEITIDQWLVLRTIEEEPGISQLEVAEKVFKDAASVTRIIDLLIKKGYLVREINDNDRRRYVLKISAEGKAIIKQVSKVAEENRSIALNGVSEKELAQLKATLAKICNNCS
jgi:DNA-binding MarR family transcriptional regulator